MFIFKLNQTQTIYLARVPSICCGNLILMSLIQRIYMYFSIHKKCFLAKDGNVTRNVLIIIAIFFETFLVPLFLIRLRVTPANLNELQANHVFESPAIRLAHKFYNTQAIQSTLGAQPPLNVRKKVYYMKKSNNFDVKIFHAILT